MANTRATRTASQYATQAGIGRCVLHPSCVGDSREISDSIFAAPKSVENLEDCHFYHTIEIPGFRPVEGEWDLRNRVEDYLGHAEFKGKRVLEIGTASGVLGYRSILAARKSRDRETSKYS